MGVAGLGVLFMIFCSVPQLHPVLAADREPAAGVCAEAANNWNNVQQESKNNFFMMFFI
jgi:hypothetical protein